VLFVSLGAAGYFALSLFQEAREISQGQEILDDISGLVDFIQTAPRRADGQPAGQGLPPTSNGNVIGGAADGGANAHQNDGDGTTQGNGGSGGGADGGGNAASDTTATQGQGGTTGGATGGGGGGGGTWQAQAPQLLTFDELRPRFPNIVGWIQSPGTVINYPVVQGSNNDFYLNHLPDHRRNAMGSIFVDYRNSPDFSNQITLVYGHDMRSGDKFGSFRNYRRQAHFERHNSMFIFTPSQDYEVVLFAGYVINTAEEYTPFSLLSAPDFYAHIDNIISRSVFTSGIRPQFGNRIVKLVTCTPSGPQAERLILAGVLVPVFW